MPHADTINLSRRVGGSLNRGATLSLLTNANVAAADTKAGLDAAINTAKQSLHADVQPFAARIQRAFRMDEAITDAAIAPLTTTAGLVALTQMGAGTQPDLVD